MKIIRNLFVVALSWILSLQAMSAQNQADNIINKIERDSIITIYQSAKLTERLFVEQSSDDEKNARTESSWEGDGSESSQNIAGFRIQVFSDNNIRTAKGEANAKARNITEAFPRLRTYITYDAPYWRLRVGDFRSRSDAEEVAEEIKRQFPSYSREVLVVRDRVNYSF